MGDDFVGLFEVLAIASGNVETLEFDDCFMKFTDFLMLTKVIFQEKFEEKSVLRGRQAHSGHSNDFVAILAPIFTHFNTFLDTFSHILLYFFHLQFVMRFPHDFLSFSLAFRSPGGRVDLISTETESANRE